MLGKLLKYDFYDRLKFLLIFYGLSLFFGILTRIFLNIEGSLVMNIIGQICSGATISMIFNIIINNIIRFWVRFKQNLYGDESYLTHTLPVEKKALYLSKFLVGVFSLVISFVVIVLTLIIAYYSKENLEILKGILIPVANMFDSNVVAFCLMLIFVLFLEIVNLLQVGFTGIIIGHKQNNNKVAFSVLAGFITYMVTQTFALLIMFVFALFNKDIMNLFITNDVVNLEIFKKLIYGSSFVYLLCISLCCVLNLKLFNKGVNVD